MNRGKYGPNSTAYMYYMYVEYYMYTRDLRSSHSKKSVLTNVRRLVLVHP